MSAYIDDTIAAISTPPGNGGIGIIRISGNFAVKAADQIFVKQIPAEKNNQTAQPSCAVAHMQGYTMSHGYIIDPETREVIDECMISVMRAPRSYTKEDVVEINSHGGYAVLKKILSLLYKQNVRPAQPGEFTKRAFLNGRIDLSEAEAVMDLIQAKTEAGRKAAVEQLSGRLSEKVKEIRESLVMCLAEMEVSIDYPEYEMEEEAAGHAMEHLQAAEAALRELLDTYDRGRIIKEGLRIVIAGKPNAGKSSLLNMMTGYDRAIVTEIPGTTRDSIEESIEFEGIPLLITDTAGLRETEDTVEKIGVHRTYQEISRADMLIYMIDGSEKDPDADLLHDILIQNQGLTEENVLLVINKIDKTDDSAQMHLHFKEKYRPYRTVCISLKEKRGIEQIYDRIRMILSESGIESNTEVMITNQRHKMLIENGLNALLQAKESRRQNLPLDCIAFDVWQCGNFLGEITGQSVGDDVVDMIFSKFCLGK